MITILAQAGGSFFRHRSNKPSCVEDNGICPSWAIHHLDRYWPRLWEHVQLVLISPELLVHEQLWVGAGSERHMAGIAPADLVRLTNARAGDLTET